MESFQTQGPVKHGWDDAAARRLGIGQDDDEARHVGQRKNYSTNRCGHSGRAISVGVEWTWTWGIESLEIWWPGLLVRLLCL